MGRGQCECCCGWRLSRACYEAEWVSRTVDFVPATSIDLVHRHRFFASYRASADWDYMLGNFAQLTHPLVDSVDLILQLTNETQSIALTVSDALAYYISFPVH